MSVARHAAPHVGRTPVKPIAIRRIGVVSPLGTGFGAFGAALAMQARSTPTMPDDPSLPRRPAHLVDIDGAAHLGAKGLAALNRMSQISMIACGEALGGERDAPVGVVLGTAGGSFRSITDFVRSTYSGSAPHMISPMQFPNTVMNCAAAQCAIRFGLTGVNSTVCAGDLSTLAALSYAVRMLRAGHGDRIVAGGVEEYCEFTAWSHAAGADAGEPMGEGAALFALGGGVDGALGALLGVAQRRVGKGEAAGVRRGALIRGLLDDAGIAPDQVVWRMGSDSADGEAGAREQDAVVTAGIDAGVTDLSGLASAAVGRTYAASFGFQLAAALAVAPEGVGVLTASGPLNQFGGALVRIPARTRN